MIMDVTGVELIPGNQGVDCPGNGEHMDQAGHFIECCCEECDYMSCCLPGHSSKRCWICLDSACPRAGWFFKKHLS